MKIDRYTCDLCGSPINELTNVEQIEMECTAKNYKKSFTYYVCPFCASIFKGLSDTKMENLLLDHLHVIVNKDV